MIFPNINEVVGDTNKTKITSQKSPDKIADINR